MITVNDFTRISNDINGNPRYVCHFSNLITDREKGEIWSDYACGCRINKQYELAINKANKIGGRKYHTKSYGGGIVFQSYNIQETCNRINELNATGK